ncbi:MAG: hypothetical protein ACYDHG_00015 [Desulfomonilaceae bacterium]
MSKRVSLSGQEQDLPEINAYADVTSAMQAYFNPPDGYYDGRLALDSLSELKFKLQIRLDEIDRSSTLSVFAAIEAVFRIDYLERCYQKKKDPISRFFRQLYKERGRRVSLEDDILSVWMCEAKGATPVLAKLKDALKYRHWLAHGRYWVLRTGRHSNYKFQEIYLLAETIINSFPFVS